ncbi:hypothetical protein HDE68_004174 [Pedobacter cryoconitis]|uniref:Uncharacterized protein n=1 Tax=Pedobacter cryoconitis TaxID=188932 RepID=A0A7W9E208_9SPHI|nr:hypothetical protein [Pedobacter cryoconitis]MBB5638245.1 hypothetical protein [Pedobacter cryoconitis]
MSEESIANLNPDSLDQTKERVMSANNANEIHEHLKQLGNDPKHRQRWIWELMQNAQDVAIDGKVDVNIEYNGSELTFSHNGHDFTEEDITHLIYHGSSKPGLAGKTGKFGTGFMTTHLLSKKVRVMGSLIDGRSFDFELDREAIDGKDMLRVLDKSWISFKKSISEDVCTKKTSFTYISDSNNDIQVTVDAVLGSLDSLMPAVMAFSCIIRNVWIKNRDEVSSFSIIQQDNPDEIHIYRSSTDDETIFKTKLLGDGLGTVAVPMDSQYRIMAIQANLPRLFITFPLVGTDKAFPLPFLIHSQGFEPNKEREKIWIEADTAEAKANKSILEAAFSAYYEICRLISSSTEYMDIHLLAGLGGMPSTEWLDRDWYAQKMVQLFEKMDSLPLVASEGGTLISLDAATVPYSDPPVYEQLWTAWNQYQDVKVPQLRQAIYWKNLLDDRITFSKLDQHPSAKTLKDLCERIDATEGKKLDHIRVKEGTAEEFLIYLIKVIENSNNQDLWTEFTVLANQSGELRKSGNLQREETSEKQIEDRLKDISSGLDFNVRDMLINPLLVIKSKDHQLQEYKKSTLVNALVDKVKTTVIAEKTEIFQNNTAQFLFWLIEDGQGSALPGYPILMRSKKWEKIASGADLFLGPVSIWQQGFQDYAELFNDEFILDDSYLFMFLEENSTNRTSTWLLPGPLYSETATIKPENIRYLVTKREDRDKLSSSKSGEWAMVDTIELSQIAYFSRPADKGVIDRVRGSIRRTKLLLEMITQVLLREDQYGTTRKEVTVESDGQKVQVSIFPSIWMRDIKARDWIKSNVSNTSDKPSVESLLPYFTSSEESRVLYSSLQKPEVVRWLHFLDIGVGDLLRNIRSGDDEDERMDWDQSYVSILMNKELTPEKVTGILGDSELLAAYDIKKQEEETRKKNKEIGALVEAAFFEAVSQLPGYRIKRVPIGSDYVVDSDDDHYLLLEREDKRKLTIEIKSSRSVQVKMTGKQGDTAQELRDNYILCVVPLDDSPIDISLIHRNALFVTDIASLLDKKVERVRQIKYLQDMREEFDEENQIWTDLSGLDVRYVIGKALWSRDRDAVFGFSSFVDRNINQDKLL